MKEKEREEQSETNGMGGLGKRILSNENNEFS